MRSLPALPKRRDRRSTPLRRLEALEERLVLSRIVLSDSLNWGRPGNVQLVGDAYWDYTSAGFIELTHDVRERGSAIVSWPSEAFASRATEFTMEIEYSIFHGNAADGMSFGYAPLSGQPFGVNHSEYNRGLWFLIDTYPNPPANFTGIELVLDGATLYSELIDRDTLRTTNDTFRLEVHKSGGTYYASFSTPFTSESNFPLPGWNPASDWRWGIGAQTGDSWDRHRIESIPLIRDDSEPASSQVAFTPATPTAYTDESLAPAFQVSVSDENGDLKSVDWELRRLENGVWNPVDSGSVGNLPKDGSARNFSRRLSPSVDGLGEFQLVVDAQDVYRPAPRSFPRLSPTVTIVDDDPVGPEITLQTASGAALNDVQVVEPRTAGNGFSWNVSDAVVHNGQLTNSGVSSVTVAVTRDGVALPGYPRSVAASGSLSFDGMGPGVYDIEVVATDNDTDRGTADRSTSVATGSIVVTNAPPVFEAGRDRSGVEGVSLNFSPVFASDAEGDALTVQWDFGDGSTATGSSVSHIYAEDGEYLVSVTVDDGYGGVVQDTFDVRVANAPPRINSVLSNSPVDPGETAQLSVVASDVAADDLRIEFDLDGDGVFEFESSDGTAEVSFSEPNLYAIGIRVSDDDGGVSSTFASVQVGPPAGVQPEISFQTSETLIDESAGTILVVIEASEPSANAIVVPLSFSGAADLDDYAADADFVLIPAGQTQAEFSLNILDDSRDEPDSQELLLTLGAPLGGLLGATTTHTLRIQDNDELPAMSFTTASQEVEESAGLAAFVATLTHPSELDVTADLLFSGTASDNDFTVLGDATVTFPPGEQFAIVRLELTDDALSERIETVIAALDAPQNAVLASNPAVSVEHTIFIPANDAPTVSFDRFYERIGEGDGAVSITASLSAAHYLPISVPLSFGGDASQGSDWTTSGTTLEFPAGATTATLNITLVNNSVAEPEETLVVQMGAPTGGATLGTTQSAVRAIEDNDTPLVSFSTSSQSVHEYQSGRQVTVRMSNPSTETVVVPIEIAGGSATVDFDYERPVDSVTFPPNATTAKFTVSIIDDRVDEQSESISLRLGQPTDEGGRSSLAELDRKRLRQSITIIDNDVSAYIGRIESAVAEEVGYVEIEVGLTDSTNEPIDVTLSLRGTADVGSEVYFDDGSRQTVRFAPGQTRATVRLYIEDDARGEFAEYVEVYAASSDGVRVDGQGQRLVITDSDQLTAEFIGDRIEYRENHAFQPIHIRLNDVADYDTTVFIKDPRRDEPDAVTIPAGSPLGTYMPGGVHNDNNFDVTKHIYFRLVGGLGVQVDPTDAFHIVVYDDEVEDARDSSNLKKRWDYARWVDGRNLDQYIDDLGRSLDESWTQFIKDPHGWWEGIKSQATTTWHRLLDQALPIAVNFIIDTPVSAVSEATCVYAGAATAGAVTAATLGATGIWAAGISLGVQRGCSYVLGEVLKNNITEAGEFEEELVDAISSSLKWVATGVLDGPIYAGQMFFDANKNGVQDFVDSDGDGFQDPNELAEPTMPDMGKGVHIITVPLEFDTNGDAIIDTEDGQLAVAGGTDSSTGLPLETPLTAPFPSAIVSPLTTLASELVNHRGLSRDDAEIAVFAAFGIASGDNGHKLYEHNSVFRTANGRLEAALAFRAGALVHNSMDQIAGYVAGLPGGPTVRAAGMQAYRVLAESFLSGDPPDLTNAFAVAGLTSSVAAEFGLFPSSQQLSAVGQAISAGNQMIQDVPLEPGLVYLEQVAAVQVVAQGAIAEELGQFAAGALDETTLLQQTTGAGLSSRVGAAEVGQFIESEVSVRDGRLLEGDHGQTVMTFEVERSVATGLPVTVQYNTVDANDATDGVDFLGAAGSLTWGPGETGVKTIEVPILGDIEFEGTEQFELWLHSPENAFLYRQMALGWIEDNDALDLEIAPSSTGDVSVIVYADQRITVSQEGADLFTGMVSQEQVLSITNAASDTRRVTIDLDSNPDFAGTLHLDGGAAGLEFQVSNGLVEHVAHHSEGAQGSLTADGVTVTYSNGTLINKTWAPTVVGLPPTAAIQAPIQVTAAYPDRREEPVRYDWTVSADGLTVASGSGSDFQFVPANLTTYDVTVEVEYPSGVIASETRSVVVSGPLSAEVSLDASGNLVVADLEGVDNQFHVTLADGVYRISDPNHVIGVDPAIGSGVSAHEVVVPVENVSGGVIVQAGAGNDRLTVDDDQDTAGLNISVAESGVAGLFGSVAYSDLEQLTVLGGEGDDRIDAAPGLTLPIELASDGGSDELAIDLAGISGPAIVAHGAVWSRETTDFTYSGFATVTLSDEGIAEDYQPDDFYLRATNDSDRLTVRPGAGGQFSLDLLADRRREILGPFGAFGGRLLVNALDGDDRIQAHTLDAPMLLDGGLGRDFLYSGSGNDLLIGGPGANYLYAGDGDNVLSGGDDRDTLIGGAGRDIIHAGDGRDYLRGFAGDDILLGEGGDDYLDGSDGNDLLDGGAGRDRLFAGAGNDVLLAGADRDDLRGDAGSDLLVAASATAYENGSGSQSLTGLDDLVQLLADWQSGDLLGVTTQEDDQPDRIFGGGDRDSFAIAGRDRIYDRADDEPLL